MEPTFIISHSLKLGPRVGKLSFARPTGSIEIQTPGLLTTSSRGTVPHLSGDHVYATDVIQWINIPFESFLERTEPLPTIQDGMNSLHKLFGFDSAKHVLSISPRDPADTGEMPPNGNNYIKIKCVRGVRTLAKDAWRSYTHTCQHDLVLALSDTPFTPPPYSQKRLTKSVDRSLAWLADLLKPPLCSGSQILVQMAGGSSLLARRAFSDGLLELLHGKEAEAVQPLKRLDDGVAGYVFDLAPLRQSQQQLSSPSPTEPLPFESLIPLLQASLTPLPRQKPRIANTINNPQEILLLIQLLGMDLFDAHWAQHAGQIGIALDFSFPVQSNAVNGPRERDGRRLDLGHNLFDARYAQDFGRLADGFLDGLSSGSSGDRPVCKCIGCSPMAPPTRILHSLLDEVDATAGLSLPPYSRAYLHHLLHTHEMASHSILVAHNLSVVEHFLLGIRKVLTSMEPDKVEEVFSSEVKKFLDMYDATGVLVREAELCWREVNLARGKGRLARERAKAEEESPINEARN